MKNKKQFVFYFNDSEPNLESKKIYQVFSDKSAEQDYYIRIIDESGEDYLYPKDYFVPNDVPNEAERAFAIAF